MKEFEGVYLVGMVGFAVGVLLGIVLTVIVSTLSHKNYHEVIKTSIGEIILKDGKLYTVYEMQRTPNGDMVAR